MRRALRRSIRWLGKKRAHGHGRVLDIEVDVIEEDYSMVRDGITMRWLPHVDGTRLIRPRPPYWSSCGRVVCAEIGAAQ